MTINTKFGIGDKVYVIYEYDGDVIVSKDKIVEISIGETEVTYYVSIIDDEIKEDNLVLDADRDKVIDKIDKLLKKEDI